MTWEEEERMREKEVKLTRSRDTRSASQLLTQEMTSLASGWNNPEDCKDFKEIIHTWWQLCWMDVLVLCEKGMKQEEDLDLGQGSCRFVAHENSVTACALWH